ncbi:MAG TPA: methyltransferase [bacterium]|nr:methyltransferase [bacterium]
MKPFLLTALATLAFFALLLIKVALWRRGNRQRQARRDPTYWALLAAMSLLLGVVVAEAWLTPPRANGFGFGLGLAMIAAALAWIGWARHALGSNYSPTAENPDPAQTLVTAGPYRLMKHPLYWGNLVLFAGLLLLAQARYAWIALAPLAATLVWRIHREEYFMRNKFKNFE